MEIKVRCGCGTLYTFEDEPVDGKLKFPVSCTNCGADGTEKAHAYIAAKLSGGPDPTEEKRKGLAGLFKKKPDGFQIPHAEEDSPDASPRELVLAAAGALGVGAAGAFGWLLLAKATGFQFGLVAWALGGLVGFTVRMLAPRGHASLGVIGAVAALVAIGGGQLLTSRWAIRDVTDRFVEYAYTQAADYAMSASSVTEDELLVFPTSQHKLALAVAGPHPAGELAMFRQFQLEQSIFTREQLIKRERPILLFAKQAEAGNRENVTSRDIQEFKMKALPELKAFAEGKPSKEEYEGALRKSLESRITFKSLLLASFSPLAGLFALLGISTAYKAAQKYPKY